MDRALLVDFGSTFTKLTVLNLDNPVDALVARTAVPTTVDDISVGLRRGLARLEKLGVAETDFSLKLACSSAAGGLRIVAIGLVPELTAEAARRAALGAGARVIDSFSGLLKAGDVQRIATMAPDMLLLAGGTDGGNEKALLHNAQRLAEGPEELASVPIVVAGNEAAAPRARAVLAAAEMDVRVADNVMPDLGVISVEPARHAIRTLFMERIVQAKGLDAAEDFVEGVLMPTPAAVLAAARLLAEGTDEQPGFGEVLLVDVGGATTDVHSIGAGTPGEAHVTMKGLPEPVAKRTVEGDLGVRVSVASLVDVVGMEKIVRRVSEGVAATGDPSAVADRLADERKVASVVAKLVDAPASLPANDFERRVDLALARLSAEEAARRHAGRMEERLTPVGLRRFLTGKDLRPFGYVIGTGGVIVHSERPAYILQGCLYEVDAGHVLLPEAPRLLLDGDYILSACGLLAQRRPEAALAILKHHLHEAA